jgi:hypothetical protein
MDLCILAQFAIYRKNTSKLSSTDKYYIAVKANSATPKFDPNTFIKTSIQMEKEI